MKRLFVIALSFLMIACSEETTKLDETSKNTVDDFNPVYLAENGITIKAKDWAGIGAKGTVNDIKYTVVDNDILEHMIENGDNLNTACTTKCFRLTELFNQASSFNQDISSWDVSNVTTMNNMFDSSSFNQDLSAWDVGNVTNMSAMFADATSFNQDLNAWNVSNVTTMEYMFYNASSFNQGLNSWDVSNVLYFGSFDNGTPQWILSKPNFN